MKIRKVIVMDTNILDNVDILNFLEHFDEDTLDVYTPVKRTGEDRDGSKESLSK
jgi:hypothetical protein